MNKVERHSKIKRMIQKGHISTQEEIKQLLSLEGIVVTQATLSRDLREIGLLKLRDAEGKLYYTLSDVSNGTFLEAVLPYIERIARSGALLVIHTQLGDADVLANIIDAEKRPQILGTVAGADTLIVVCQNETAAEILESDISLAL